MATKAPVKKPWLQSDIELGGISLNDKAIFAKNLAMMLKSGMTLNEGFAILSRTSASGRLRNIIKELNNSVSAGSSLSEALSRNPKVFSGFFVGSIYAGEASGTLSENMDKVAQQLIKERDLRAKIAGTLVYPVTVMLAAIVLAIFAAYYILPKILPMFTSMRLKLPFTTVILMTMANFLQNYGGWFLLGLFSLAVLSVLLWRWPKLQPFTHGLLLKLPVISAVNRALNLTRFFRVLGMMLASGLNIMEALQVAGNTLNNYHYRFAVSQIRKAVGKGASLSSVVYRYHSLFPEIAIKMIAVGEASGRLEETLAYLADFYEAEIDGVTKNLGTYIEIVMLLGIGLSVGFLTLAIITPIYNITGSIGR
ncbi:MAG: type II secretion system F family protein [Candidatus Falkowbacteria bacterium]